MSSPNLQIIRNDEELRAADLLGDKEPWQDRGLCQQTDPAIFFPEKGESNKDAKKICARCEVKTECLEWALANDERFGVAGGLSERERRAMKKKAAA